LPGRNGKQPETNLAAAVTEVSERVTVLIKEEVELAKAEMSQKVSSLSKGLIAGAAAAICGTFAIIFFPLTLAWVLDAIFVDGLANIWIGFAIVLLLFVLGVVGFGLLAWRKIRAGVPAPTMAIDEAKKIRETVKAGNGH
jgi:uncharacterized small protein (DUF1192 family)